MIKTLKISLFITFCCISLQGISQDFYTYGMQVKYHIVKFVDIDIDACGSDCEPPVNFRTPYNENNL